MPKSEFGANVVVEIYQEIAAGNPSQDFPDLWRQTKDRFTEMAKESGKVVDTGQTWKTSSGKAFEKLAIAAVLGVLEGDELKSKNVEGKRWSELSKLQKVGLSHEMIRRCSDERILLSNEPDIVIHKGARPMVILSCKSSLRDRVSMDLFWAGKYREGGKRFVVVSAETSQSIGTHARPKKPRRIAECLYDRLYIVNGQTDYCEVVRPFSDLERDLIGWLS